jgi:hypothetical protein
LPGHWQAKEQEAIRAEVEKELKATFDEQLKQRMVQCEKEIIEFYRQKIDEVRHARKASRGWSQAGLGGVEEVRRCGSMVDCAMPP